MKNCSKILGTKLFVAVKNDNEFGSKITLNVQGYFNGGQHEAVNTENCR